MKVPLTYFPFAFRLAKQRGLRRSPSLSFAPMLSFYDLKTSTFPFIRAEFPALSEYSDDGAVL